MTRKHIKKTIFLRAAFGMLLITALTWVGLTDAAAENPTLAVIDGRVIDETGNPVAGVTVRPAHIYFLNKQPGGVKTDENGAFQFELESKHINPWFSFFAVTEDQTLLGNGQIKLKEGETKIPNVEITIKPARVITGTVVDEDGNPVEGATVAGCDQTTYPNLVTMDAEGKFKFAYPQNQDRPMQQIYAFKEDVGFDYLCTEEIDKYQGTTPTEKISDGPFQLTLSAIKPVEFKVVNKNGKPISDAYVGVWLVGKKGESDRFNASGAPDFFDTRTNAEGMATLRCLPEWAVNNTRYSAYGPKEGILQEDGTLVFYGGDDKRMDEFEENRLSVSNVLRQVRALSKDENHKIIPTFVLPKQARVTGTVKLADGTPVPWTRITRSNYAACGHGIRFPDANGEFELQENANQKLNLAVDESRFGATPGVFAFDVGDGNSEKTLDFVIEKGIRLHGTVYGLDDKPLDKEYQVFIYEKDPNLVVVCDPDDEDCETCSTGDSIVIRQTSNYGEGVLDGKYEYILPAMKRDYSINASLFSAEGSASHEFTLTGDETEYELDLHLKVEEE